MEEKFFYRNDVMSPHLIVPGLQLYYPQKTSASHPVGLYSHRPIRRQRYGFSIDE